MQDFLIVILESFLLTAAISIDIFMASVGYGIDNIKVPTLSTIIISGVCSLMLGISLFIGSKIENYIPVEYAKLICFLILFILGTIKIFDSSIKSYIIKRKNLNKKFSFSALHLNFILNIYADPKEADRDSSRYLSPTEAISLAIAMSIDGLAVGFGAALTNSNLWITISISFVLGIFAIIFGQIIGQKISQKSSLNISWLGGTILIFLAILKIF